SVHRLLNVEMPLGAGFSQQLHTRIQGSPSVRWTVLGCTQTLHVLGEGLMRSPGLLLSHQFGEALSTLQSIYDFIVIDGPTASVDVDSRALAAVSNGVVLVRPRQDSADVAYVESLFAGRTISYV